MFVLTYIYAYALNTDTQLSLSLQIGNLEDVYLFKHDELGGAEQEPSITGNDVQKEEQLRSEPNVRLLHFCSQ